MVVLCRRPSFLLILLFVPRTTKPSATSTGPYSRVERVTAGTRLATGSPFNGLVNVTVDCGDYGVLRETVYQCQRDIYILASYGYPWSPHAGNQRNHGKNVDVKDKNDTLGDALDSLNHVCRIHDRSRRCVEESGIENYCLSTIATLYLPLDFQFICHYQMRDEKLVQSLACLRDNRVMVMLYFEIANRCRGMAILDDIMRRYKRAYFYLLGIYPSHGPLINLYCVPKSVIFTCVRDIVEDQCGTMAAHFVQNYLLYLQDWFDQSLESVGLNSNICDQDIAFHMVPGRETIRSSDTKRSIPTLLKMTAPGTALDTVRGKMILAYLHMLSGDLCATDNANLAYEACVMSSDNMSEKTKFNILQFAHRQLPVIYHGTQCSRLEQFTACWNLLHQICGPNVRGFEQHATLLVEGCMIQSEMDTAECRWQNILLPHYIQASRVTVWPMGEHCLVNPMMLEDLHYGTFDDTLDDLNYVVSLLQPAVGEISKKCGSQPTERLRLLLKKLRYTQRDILKFRPVYLKDTHMIPT